MPIKRVCINISLPSEEFKRMVQKVAKVRQKSPSEEVVDLYRRLARITPPQ